MEPSLLVAAGRQWPPQWLLAEKWNLPMSVGARPHPVKTLSLTCRVATSARQPSTFLDTTSPPGQH